MKSACRGTTLFELLVAIVVVSILAALAVPAYGSIIARNNIVVSANQLLNATHGARLLALTRNTTVSFCAGNPKAGCSGDWSDGEWISFIDRNHDGKLDTNETLHANGRLPRSKNLALGSNGPFKRTILFRPSGNATWPSGAFAAGRMRVCSPAAGSPAVELILIGSGRTVLQKHAFSSDQCPAL